MERVRLKPKTAKEKKADKIKQARLRARRSMLFRNPDANVDQRTGRPTKFKVEFITKTKELCLAGATNAQLADEFGVSINTITNWQRQHPEFLLALAEGKNVQNEMAERSLVDMATGYFIDVPVVRSIPILDEQGNLIKDGKRVLTEEVETLQRRFIPPDPGAAKMLLSARKRALYNDKVTIDHTGTVEHQHSLDRELLERLVEGVAGVRKRLLNGPAREMLVREGLVIEGTKV